MPAGVACPIFQRGASMPATVHQTSMAWLCVIVVDRSARRREAARLIARLRSAWRAANCPAGAEVHVNLGSACRCTFLLSPTAAAMARRVLRHYDATPCAVPPRLERYAPLPW